jgi:FO synthase
MRLERLLADIDPEVARILDSALAGRELPPKSAARLLRAEGADFQALLRAADLARKEDAGDDVTFVVNRNMNFTNICYVGCSFCGFSRHKEDEDAYDRSMAELREKASKSEFPKLHLHAFSPEEIDFGHRKSGMELRDYLRWLMEAGLGTMPGTAAEILDDSIRRILSPKKLMTDRWVEIVRTAHSVGLPSSSTLMYGHIENAEHVASCTSTWDPGPAPVPRKTFGSWRWRGSSCAPGSPTCRCRG